MSGPTWLRPTAVLAVAYLALIGAATFLFSPVWHEWDWSVFQYLSNLRAPAFARIEPATSRMPFEER